MIVYNVTVKIDLEIAANWLAWMREEHIPEVLATGLFLNYRLLRIVNDEEDDGLTYAVQYTCRDKRTFETYLKDYAQALQAKHRERYNNRYIAIRTLMEVVEEQNLFASQS